MVMVITMALMDAALDVAMAILPRRRRPPAARAVEGANRVLSSCFIPWDVVVNVLRTFRIACRPYPHSLISNIFGANLRLIPWIGAFF